MNYWMNYLKLNLHIDIIYYIWYRDFFFSKVDIGGGKKEKKKLKEA